MVVLLALGLKYGYGGIVGAVENQPAYWKHGELTVLPTGEYAGGYTYSISNNGTIVGYVFSDGISTPAMWKKGKLITLSKGDYLEGYAYCINDSGEVGGVLYNQNGQNQPVVWEK